MEVAEGMNEPELTSEVRRVNGFAPGDRVAIVDCELAGAYGKVTESRGGCVPHECRVDCYLVFVELMSKPLGVEERWQRPAWLHTENTRRFKVSEVTHVD